MLLDMYRSWQSGNNVVLAVREGRGGKPLAGVFSRNLYYAMTRKFALPGMPQKGFDVFLVDRRVIEVLKRMDEPNSALTGQILWSGFKNRRGYLHPPGAQDRQEPLDAQKEDPPGGGYAVQLFHAAHHDRDGAGLSVRDRLGHLGH